MTLLRAIVGEFRKTMTLPAGRVGVAIALLAPVGVALLSAISRGPAHGAASPSPADAIFAASPLGTVGAVILGVVVVSSEYTVTGPDAGGGRQITTTLAAIPSRIVVLVSKAAVVAIITSLTAVVTTTVGAALVRAVVGGAVEPDALPDLLSRSAGLALYGSCMALIALAVTVLTRSGIAPLAWFIANSSLVSVSLLLSKLTLLARYLPDLAGMRLFASPASIAVRDPLDPSVGGLVMSAWALAFLVVATVVFARRDA
jgi:hypothetical protein